MEALALVIWIIGWPLGLDISDALAKKYFGEDDSKKHIGVNAMIWGIGIFLLFLNVVNKS